MTLSRRALLPLLLAPLAAPTLARAASPLRVVASFSILADMTATIGGDAISIATLVPVDGDAHVWQPRPADLKTLHAADMLVENGLGLEGWIGRMAQAAEFRGARVTASRAVKPRTMTEDGRRITDPHAWQDPRNGVLYTQAIADGLVRAAPAQAEAIRARASAYAAEIAATDSWIAEQFAPIPPAKRRIITSHDAFGYYAARYGITMQGVQGISTEGEPSARDIAKLIAQIKATGIRAVFVENMTDPRIATTVAREAGAVVGGQVFSDALSPPDGPAGTYLKMLRHNTTLFVGAMKG